MALGDLFGALAGGFGDASARIRQDNLDRSERERERETRMLTALANDPSADPEMKAAAYTALLTPRSEKQGFMAKWFGQQAEHPAYSQILAMLGQEPGDGARPVQMPRVAVAGPQGVDSGPQRQIMGLPAEAPARAAAAPTSTRGFYPPGAVAGMTTYEQRRNEIRARLNTADEFGVDLTPAGREEVITGRTRPRTAQGRVASYNLVLDDGTPDGLKMTGFRDSSGHMFIDTDRGPVPYEDWGMQIRQATTNVPNAGGARGLAARTMSAAQAQAEFGALPPGVDPKGYVRVDYPNGHDQPPRITNVAYTPPSAFTTVIPNVNAPGGVTAVTRGGAFVNPEIPGGAVQRPVDPGAYANQLRANRLIIEQTAEAATPGGKDNAAQYQLELDKAATAVGYPSYAALLSLIGAATTGVEQRVSPGPPPEVTPRGRGRGAVTAPPAGATPDAGREQALKAFRDALRSGRGAKP